ncbi:hypothetical protein BDB00DRAFT_109800 [Zychaea mexicana]|uniref:uncharacterized protein n=1 Tax=Zychaea mexicana TaxID=64656 RepID=UPI0022FED250|nr:uncharacterized protein BDB00DRAFT_109800 [Zychaea mexicana]KAI9484822.1 hypothetical protein BDB00DRAFT_109800 [Zychaea mexicana]
MRSFLLSANPCVRSHLPDLYFFFPKKKKLMPTEPHEEAVTKDGQQHLKRIPRRQYRKERKLAARKARRQQHAEQRDRLQQVNEQQALNDHSEYLQQKQLWEEREQRYELINAVRKRAEEAERVAKEVAKQKWREALLRMPMLPPSMTTNTSDSIDSTGNQANIRNMPKFVSRDNGQRQSSKKWPDIDGDTINWP